MKILVSFVVVVSVITCGYRPVSRELLSLPPFPKKEKPLSKKEVIILDAGHGGKDPGAISKKNKYEEKLLTLETVQLVLAYLQKQGYTIVLTRSHDIYIPLSMRAEIANTNGADLFISIHYNYSSNQEVEGIEIYYYKEEKDPPSQRIIKSKDLGFQVLKAMVKSCGAESRGVKKGDFAVIRQTQMPAILIEAGFLSNPKERDKLRDQQYLQLLARGIGEGIHKYLSSRKKSP